MAREHYLRIGVSEDLFDRLDDARHAQRATFQEIGEKLFVDWLNQQEQGRSNEQPPLIPTHPDLDPRFVARICDLISAPQNDAERAIAGMLTALLKGN